MTENTYWDFFKAESENVISKIKGLIHEGNVRRVLIQHHGHTVADFPLTAGVVGAEGEETEVQRSLIVRSVVTMSLSVLSC
jgi:hypothetical protein